MGEQHLDALSITSRLLECFGLLPRRRLRDVGCESALPPRADFAVRSATWETCRHEQTSPYSITSSARAINLTGVLVKPDIARKQFNTEMAAVPASPDAEAGSDGTATTGWHWWLAVCTRQTEALLRNGYS
jgi:hypothetical protein